MSPPIFHKDSGLPVGEKKSTAETQPKPTGGGSDPAESQSATAPPATKSEKSAQGADQPGDRLLAGPPSGTYSLLREICIEVHGGPGLVPFYLVQNQDGTEQEWHGSQVGVQNDVRNRLHPPPGTVG